jgi:hypothetical protein
MEKREEDITAERQTNGKKGKAEKGEVEITEYEIMKRGIRKEGEIQRNLQERIWSSSCYIFSNLARFMYYYSILRRQATLSLRMLILCSDQKMIPARKAINAHGQISLVNDKLLFPIQKTSGKCTC